MSILKTFQSLSKQLEAPEGELKSFYVEDPLTGTVVIHGATNNRPKAYAGEVIACPWDSPTNILLRQGSAFLYPNDFPALSPESIHDELRSELVDGIYPLQNARGECLVVIYTDKHEGHWLTLDKAQLLDVVELWAASTVRAQKEGYAYAHIFENDGSLNTMHHPHGQQYNLAIIPPFIQNELARSARHYQEHSQNLLQKLLTTEQKTKDRIIYENASFVIYAPPGAKWPYQTRILPKSPRVWLIDLNQTEKADLVDGISAIRRAYQQFFSKDYHPTLMINLIQAPLDGKEEEYRRIYGFHVDIYCTALSDKAEKLMFSLENGTGLIAYSDTPEEIAERLRNSL